MKMMTKKIEKRLPRLYSTEGVPMSDRVVAVKYFDPGGLWTWYALEGDPEVGGLDYEFFGVVCGLEVEAGYFRLSELCSARKSNGLSIERDLHPPATLGDAAKNDSYLRRWLDRMEAA